MKIWLLQQGLPLTAPFKNKCGGRGTQRARTLGYIECLIDYLTDLRDADVNEITKDVWKIEKLDIQVKQDLIRPRKTISFTGISQPELKAMADYVTGDVDKNGLYDAFEKLGLL